MTPGGHSGEIEEYWDAHGAGAGDFMQLLDWADLDTATLREQLNRVSMPAFVDDSETTCLAINNALRSAFGIEEENFRDIERLEAVSPARQLQLDALIHDLWSSGKAFSATVELKCKNSQSRWFWMRATPLKNSAGELVRAIGLVIDIHERVLAQQELQRSAAQIRMLLDSLADPVVAIDAAQRICIWNQPAEAMFGYREDEVLNKSVSMLLPPDGGDRYSTLVAEYFDSDETGRFVHDSVISLQHRDGSPIRAEINLSKMELQDSVLAVATIRDVAEREALLESQHKADEKFSALIERSSDAVLILSASEVITYASPAIERLSGYRPDQTVGFDLEVLLSNVHPDDRAWIQSGIRGIQLEHAARGDFDYRQIHRDGQVKYISASVTNYLNVEGIAGLVFNMRDVSEAKLLETRVETQNDELKAVLAAFPDLLHQITSQGMVVKCLTPATSEFLETTQVVGESIRATMAEDSGAEFEKVVSRVSSLSRSETVEFSAFNSALSSERSIEARVSPLPNGDVLASFRDVSAERELQLQLLHQASHDDLTGLPNRTLLTDALGLAIKKAGSKKLGVGVLFLDLDGFKGVNDRFGHQSGDGLLIEVALRLRAVVRPQDTVARIGGDEFVIVCASLRHHHEAEVLADRICLSMGLPFEVEGQEVLISTSIGIAFADDSVTGVEALIARADAAMYSAKELGKGRAEVFNTSML